MTWLFIAAIILAVIYDILNGYNDGGSIIGTLVSAPFLTPARIVLFVCFFELCGMGLLYVLGLKIAQNLAQISVMPISPAVILASVSAAVIWKIFTLYMGIPTSSSHALIGGLGGALFVAYGWGGIAGQILGKIVGVLLLTPVLGLFFSYVFMRAVLFLLQWATPQVNNRLMKLQLVTVAMSSALHGATEPQKTIALMFLILAAFNYPAVANDSSISSWMIIMPAVCFMSLGMLAGGWRVAKTVNRRLLKIRPLDSVTTQISSSVVIFFSALCGGIFSTSQVIGSSLVGVGLAQRFKQVRWRMVRNILVAWLITIPAAAGLSALIWKALNFYFRETRGKLWV